MAVVGVDALTTDGTAAALRVDGELYGANVSLPGAYNLYNAAAAWPRSRPSALARRGR